MQDIAVLARDRLGYDALRPGLTVVVSPLVALQRDQLRALSTAGLEVAELNSGDHAGQRQAREMLAERRPGFVLMSPEQLTHADVLELLAGSRPHLVAVDEAHLVSEWGQDFRPDYLRLAAAIRAMGRPPILALTATAAPPVRGETGASVVAQRTGTAS